MVPKPPVTVLTFPDRLRAAADIVEQINARDGLPLNAAIMPGYLRAQANQMEQEAAT